MFIWLGIEFQITIFSLTALRMLLHCLLTSVNEDVAAGPTVSLSNLFFMPAFKILSLSLMPCSFTMMQAMVLISSCPTQDQTQLFYQFCEILSQIWLNYSASHVTPLLDTLQCLPHLLIVFLLRLVKIRLLNMTVIKFPYLPGKPHHSNW